MYEIDKLAIEEKINGTRFAENEETNRAIKDSLLTIMKELCDYTQDLGQHLVDKAHTHEDPCVINNIYTALLPDGKEDDYMKAGLFKMVENSSKVNTSPFIGLDAGKKAETSSSLKRIFLDCEYDEIREIAGDLSKKKVFKGKYIKDGKSISFDYSLEFDNTFLKAQERLFDYAELYSVNNPLVLSPYSHKSFYLKYDDTLPKESLDFCFSENNIPVVGENYCLYWNIRQSEVTGKTYDDRLPYGDKIKYVYFFIKSKKGKLPLAFPLNNQTCVYENKLEESGVKIVTDHEMDDFLIFEYMDLDLNSSIVKECQSKNMLFSNAVDAGLQKKSRLLSEGDIERAVGCFRNWQGLFCDRATGKGERITRYSKKYCVNRESKTLFNTIRREYVSFKKENEKFLIDYANYILEYLEYYYPEIEWAGEI